MTQAEALTILKTGANVFLTGEPGSGKTHTINAYTEWLRDSGIEPSVTAATGIAATHVSGMTLHSWSGIGIADSLTRGEIDAIASKEHVARRIARAKVLILDEVSMLGAGAFAAADAVCREVRRADAPFGGLQVVLVGDFFQLPPVKKAGRENKFAYESATWRALNPIVCYLSEQHRQEDDAYLGVLSAIRAGDVGEMHYEHLNSRRVSGTGAPADAPKLYSHNVDVDRINAAELAKLSSISKRFTMTSRGRDALIEGLKRGCLSPEILELKEGAKVMFTKNNPQGRFVNGTLGTVLGFDSVTGAPVVETHDGDRIQAEQVDWQVEENGKIRAAITQVPLRLAYAMTIHKSQGMSMDAAVMDLSQAFEYGQGYVALSRVRTLAGVHLLGVNQRALEVHPEILEKDKDFRGLSNLAEHTFAEMPKREVEELQKKFVKAMGGAWIEEGKVKKEAGGKKKSSGMPPRLAETLSVVRESSSLSEAAKARGLAVSTVVGHLEELHEIGKLAHTDYAQILPEARSLGEIQDAWSAVGGDKLTPIFKALKGRYSFEVIRLARLAAK